ncbi:MAG TPA: alpha/beta hydrolase [Candidatus Binatia bacterium]|nr:alpha/beta hydrolase [Candidatus Binatia bacterium]
MKRLAFGLALVLALLLGAIGLAGLLYEPDSRIRDGFAGRHVVVEGVSLRVVQQGSGRDVLMIHGSPGVLEDFDLQAGALQNEFRVTRYDRPGHGFSADTGSYSYADNARIAAGLIEQLQLRDTVVVGHSYGGTTALALAALKSARVSALVVLDSAVYSRIRPINPLFRYLRLPVFGPGLARILRSSAEPRLREAFTAEFKVAGPPPGFVDLRLPVFAEPKVLHATANEHSGSDEELSRLSPNYGKIELPLYVVAQRDDEARRATAERLEQEVPGAEALLVSPSGHYVQIEQAEAVTQVIRRAAREN